MLTFVELGTISMKYLLQQDAWSDVCTGLEKANS